MKVKRFRIYLGHNNETQKRFDRDDVINFFNEYFEGFTVIKTDGVYQGTTEESYVIEYLQIDFSQLSGIRFYKNMVQDAKEYFEQESILLTTDEVDIV